MRFLSNLKNISYASIEFLMNDFLNKNLIFETRPVIRKNAVYINLQIGFFSHSTIPVTYSLPKPICNSAPKETLSHVKTEFRIVQIL